MHVDLDGVPRRVEQADIKGSCFTGLEILERQQGRLTGQDEIPAIQRLQRKRRHLHPGPASVSRRARNHRHFPSILEDGKRCDVLEIDPLVGRLGQVPLSDDRAEEDVDNRERAESTLNGVLAPAFGCFDLSLCRPACRHGDPHIAHDQGLRMCLARIAVVKTNLLHQADQGRRLIRRIIRHATRYVALPCHNDAIILRRSIITGLRIPFAWRQLCVYRADQLILDQRCLRLRLRNAAISTLRGGRRFGNDQVEAACHLRADTKLLRGYVELKRLGVKAEAGRQGEHCCPDQGSADAMPDRKIHEQLQRVGQRSKAHARKGAW